MKSKTNNPNQNFYDSRQPIRLRAKMKAREHSLIQRENGIDYLSFLENLPVMLYAAEPHPPFAPLYVSSEFASLGYPLEDWYASADLWMKAIHPDDRDGILAATEAAMMSGGETDLNIA
jgi:hypothetical protein